MSLWTRLTQPQPGETQISIEAFMAYIGELQDQVPGFDREDMIAELGIQPNEEAALDQLKALYQAASDKQKFMEVLGRILNLAEQGMQYTSPAQAIARLTGL